MVIKSCFWRRRDEKKNGRGVYTSSADVTTPFVWADPLGSGVCEERNEHNKVREWAGLWWDETSQWKPGSGWSCIDQYGGMHGLWLEKKRKKIEYEPHH